MSNITTSPHAESLIRLDLRTVISIDLATLVSGTALRGAFEQKFKALLADIEVSNPDLIPDEKQPN
jgi:ATP-dependent Clp protease ATP-binding subunit ClpA